MTWGTYVTHLAKQQVSSRRFLFYTTVRYWMTLACSDEATEVSSTIANCELMCWTAAVYTRVSGTSGHTRIRSCTRCYGGTSVTARTVMTAS